jgi:prolyl-tRNA editing enzyme YbaK/EbsC (Cys-tRNA(Pro) deacylase)
MRGREVRSADLDKRLQRFISRTGIHAPVVQAREVRPTAEAAAFELGVPLSQIVRTLVFRHESAAKVGSSEMPGTSYVVAILPVDHRVDSVRLSRCCGVRTLRAAKPEEILRVTGSLPDGVAAIGFSPHAKVVVDVAVMAQPVVICRGGRADLLMLVRPEDIVRTNGAMVCKLSKEET